MRGKVLFLERHSPTHTHPKCPQVCSLPLSAVLFPYDIASCGRLGQVPKIQVKLLRLKTETEQTQPLDTLQMGDSHLLEGKLSGSVDLSYRVPFPA